MVFWSVYMLYINQVRTLTGFIALILHVNYFFTVRTYHWKPLFHLLLLCGVLSLTVMTLFVISGNLNLNLFIIFRWPSLHRNLVVYLLSFSPNTLFLLLCLGISKQFLYQGLYAADPMTHSPCSSDSLWLISPSLSFTLPHLLP